MLCFKSLLLQTEEFSSALKAVLFLWKTGISPLSFPSGSETPAVCTIYGDVQHSRWKPRRPGCTSLGLKVQWELSQHAGGCLQNRPMGALGKFATGQLPLTFRASGIASGREVGGTHGEAQHTEQLLEATSHWKGTGRICLKVSNTGGFYGETWPLGTCVQKAGAHTTCTLWQGNLSALISVAQISCAKKTEQGCASGQKLVLFKRNLHRKNLFLSWWTFQ